MLSAKPPPPRMIACVNCKSPKTCRTGAFSVERVVGIIRRGDTVPPPTLMIFDRRCEECGTIFAERTVRFE